MNLLDNLSKVFLLSLLLSVAHGQDDLSVKYLEDFSDIEISWEHEEYPEPMNSMGGWYELQSRSFPAGDTPGQWRPASGLKTYETKTELQRPHTNGYILQARVRACILDNEDQPVCTGYSSPVLEEEVGVPEMSRMIYLSLTGDLR